MTFEEFLKTKKIKIKKDRTPCKTSMFSMHDNKKFYDHITNEDMERIKVMQRYLFLNHDITENEFFGELKKKFKDYYKLIKRHPYKKLTFIDLQTSSEVIFASTIEAYEDLHPKKRFLNIFGKSK